MDCAGDKSPIEECVCPGCSEPTRAPLLKQTGYACPRCGFGMAHLDLGPNGTIRGTFGLLLPRGTVLHERYRIIKVLGRGGFGATYLIEDLKIKGKSRALKEIPKLQFDDLEVEILGRISHPAIPDLIDRFTDDGMVYLVLEFGGQRTVESECRRLGERIPLSRTISLMGQLCDVLAYLHAQTPPIIHRDLKPDNILLDDNDRVMLIDFGIAKHTTPDVVTRAMARAVSHGFSPPEQVLGVGTDERADIYSFGATLYYLLTGRIPVSAQERMMGKEIEAPSRLVPGLTPEVDAMLLGLLNLNATQRPFNIEDLKLILERLASPRMDESPYACQTVRLDQDAGTVPGARSLPSNLAKGISFSTTGPDRAKAEYEKGVKRKHTGVIIALAVLLVFAAACLLYISRDRRLPPGTDETAGIERSPPAMEASETEQAETQQSEVKPGDTQPAETKPSDPKWTGPRPLLGKGRFDP